MNDAVIKDKIRGFIVKNFYVAEPSSLTDDTSFLDAGIIDSTGVLELVSFIEAELGVRVDDEDMVPQNMDSITAMVAFVAKKSSVA